MAEAPIGRYQVKQTLGRGALGTVFEAFDPTLERTVAVKLFHKEGELSGSILDLLLEEARLAARLTHPNIVSVYDLGTGPEGPFIAMEYVEGDDLRDWIDNQKFVPFEQKLQMLAQLCRGLDFAHRQEVIHRDIRPNNVRIARNDQVKIMDFGMARISSSELTATGLLSAASACYMSPEQIQGEGQLDSRADLFSVGVVAYEWLSFQNPFQAADLSGVCSQVVSLQTSLSDVLPACSSELCTIIDTAMAKGKEERFDDCLQLAEALESFLSQLPAETEKLRASIVEGHGEGALADAEHSEDYGSLLLIDRKLRVQSLQDAETGSSGPTRGSIPAKPTVPQEGSPESPDPKLQKQESSSEATGVKSGPEPSQDPVDQLLRFAREAAASGRHKEALRNIEFLLGLAPGHVEATELKASIEKTAAEQTTLGLDAHAAVEKSAVASEGLKTADQPGEDSDATALAEPARPAPETATGEVLEKPSPPPVGRISKGIWLIAALFGAFALSVLALFLLLPEGDSGPAPSPPPPAVATVLLNATPWARVESIIRVSDGFQVPVNLVTPCVIPLEPALYRITLSNPKFADFGKAEVEVELAPGQFLEIHEALPGYSLETELEAEMQRLQSARPAGN